MVKRALSIGAVSAIALLATVMTLSHGVRAQTVASDRPAGYVIWPKVVVDLDDVFLQGRTVDTTVQITNVSNSVRTLQCYFVDATPRCTNGVNRFDTSTACREGQVPTDCQPGGSCQPTWNETDFTVTLSPLQPFGWSVGEGGTVPPANNSPGGIINPVGDVYFIGEVKCIEVNASFFPINANDIKGEATIYEVSGGIPGSVDVRSYNAIGVQAVSNDGAAQSDRVLCLGATSGSTECATAEYASCPAVVVLDHFFDDQRTDDVIGGERTTDLTLVPCSEDLATQTLTPTAVQFLVYNEFEQRFSASTRFQCFRETQLSRIDSRPGQEYSSIWNVAVQGTLTGQTRIRPITGPETNVGHGVLAIAEEFRSLGIPLGPGPRGQTGSAAFNTVYLGSNSGKGDFVRFDVPTNP
jgi:hypothetical protein